MAINQEISQETMNTEVMRPESTAQTMKVTLARQGLGGSWDLLQEKGVAMTLGKSGVLGSKAFENEFNVTSTAVFEVHVDFRMAFELHAGRTSAVYGMVGSKSYKTGSQALTNKNPKRIVVDESTSEVLPDPYTTTKF
ncbi:MAG: hypothetical protein M1824_001223 [Vezdaea acicularis]|nr:MAG: hypothetical protein M1824_001223 [Vezdaea acicularis]